MPLAREPDVRALQRRDALLVRVSRGIAGARVEVVARLADRGLRERRGEADRGYDRTGDGVGLLAGVDRTGLEAVRRHHQTL